MMTEHSARWGGTTGQSVSKIVLQGVAFTGSHSYGKEKTNTVQVEVEIMEGYSHLLKHMQRV